MEVSQIGMIVADTHVYFTKGQDGVEDIVLHKPDATVHFKSGMELTIKENYITSYVKGNPLIKPNGGTMETLTKVQKPKKKKVRRRK